MSTLLAKSDLLARLAAAAGALGIKAKTGGGDDLRGEAEAIKAKWFLGGNKSVYVFRCHLEDATHTVSFRESVTDRSWGIAPPSFKVETYGQSGSAVTSRRDEKAVGGGGTLAFGKWRTACEQAVTEAGWRFDHEAMRAP
jgi:hypothetical protein